MSFWQFLFRQVMTDFYDRGPFHEYNDETCRFFDTVYDYTTDEIGRAANVEHYEW